MRFFLLLVDCHHPIIPYHQYHSAAAAAAAAAVVHPKGISRSNFLTSKHLRPDLMEESREERKKKKEEKKRKYMFFLTWNISPVLQTQTPTEHAHTERGVKKKKGKRPNSPIAQLQIQQREYTYIYRTLLHYVRTYSTPTPTSLAPGTPCKRPCERKWEKEKEREKKRK